MIAYRRDGTVFTSPIVQGVSGCARVPITPSLLTSTSPLWLLQADDGYLYPLERAFFYVQKPPTLLVHDEIESVEFLRQGGTGMLASSAKTFDLSIRMQSSDQVSICFLRKGQSTPGICHVAASHLEWLAIYPCCDGSRSHH